MWQRKRSPETDLKQSPERDDPLRSPPPPLVVQQQGGGVPNEVETTIVRRQQNKKLTSYTAASSHRLQEIILKWLKFYIRFLQTSPLHQDRLLKALQWTTWLASVLLIRTVRKKNKASISNAAASAAAAVSQSLQTLSINLSFARYATRLLEWPTALEAVWTGSWILPQTPRTLHRWLGRMTSWSMLGYYPLEYLAYILWTAPPLLPTTTTNANSNTNSSSSQAAKFSAWSCRCWLVYILAEATQCVVQLRQQQQQQQQLSEEKEQQQQRRRNIRLQLLRNVLFLLPCVHWSLPNWDKQPWLPTNTVNGLMWAEAMVSLYQSVVALPPPDVVE